MSKSLPDPGRSDQQDSGDDAVPVGHGCGECTHGVRVDCVAQRREFSPDVRVSDRLGVRGQGSTTTEIGKPGSRTRPGVVVGMHPE